MPGRSTTKQLLLILSGLDRKCLTATFSWTQVKACQITVQANTDASSRGVGKNNRLFSSSQVVQSEDEQSSIGLETNVSRSAQSYFLSPMLYNLHILDIPKCIQKDLAIYVDDICIYDPNKSPRFAHLGVQRHIDDVGRWPTAWAFIP